MTEGLKHHQAGSLVTAERLYREVLALDSRQADALHLLGVIAQQVGRTDVAVELIGKAVEIDATVADYHSNLGAALKDLGRFNDAFATFNTAVRLKPDFAEAHSNLGNVLKELRRVDEAVYSCSLAICLKPDLAEAYANLGVAQKDLGRLDDALAAYNTAILLKPNLADGHYNLGTVLQGLGHLDDAIMAYNSCLCLDPGHVKSHFNLATALKDLRRLNEALTGYNTSLRLKPDLAEAHSSLGVVIKDLGCLDEAVAACGRAIRLKPEFAEAYSNLGTVQKELAYLDEALAAFNLAIRLKPELAEAHSNLLLTMLYNPLFSAESILQAQIRSAALLYDSLTERSLPHANTADPGRRLRLGFVSADLRRHAVACFLEPVLRHLDKAAFEIFAYANQVKEDLITTRIRGEVDHWIGLVGLSDEAAAERIRANGIDLLIDLSGHTAGHRLGVFARKPAPVQLTWLGHPSGTGLAAMDYRLTDAVCDPPGLTEPFSRETLWRLPETFCCYRPDDGSPEPAEALPADANGYFTFGCCTNLAKLSEPVIALWARLLARVPTARLLLEIKGADQPALRHRLETAFAEQGIGPERLILIDRIGQPQYQLYTRIDLGLDPFPYNGGTSSFDCLWMGVPFLTLAGGHCVARLGTSLLTNLGLPELIAADEEAYVTIAATLAEDHGRLRRLREGLRLRLMASPLMDPARFTRHFEDALRAMWKDWCEKTTKQ